MALNLSKTVIDYLKSNPDQQFTAKEIATYIFRTYPHQCKDKKSRSTATIVPLDNDMALIQQISAEIGARRPQLEKKYPEIKTLDERPRRYYYSDISDETEVKQKEENISDTKKSPPLSEHDLYPILCEFLWHGLNIYPKRIDEKRSQNSHGIGGNKWLYPDLVGLEDLSQDWHTEIKHAVHEISDFKTKLWSFEVKKFINRSNVRESYFQAVSNSSWANLGYLAAAEIQGAEKEIRILSGMHGIGLIKINIENPAESEIVIPAQERTNIDWNAANRLAEENTDFLEYIKLIRQFYQTQEHRVNDWDIPNDH
jgi:hypothetical protein